MINFRKLFETVYEPRSGDEKNFKDKHVIAKHKHPVALETQFTSDKPKAKRKADYDKSEDEAVYEAAELHTKRADKEPVVVRRVDPKTGQSKAKTVMRGAGEIKIGEEVEQIDELSKDTLKSYATKKANQIINKDEKSDPSGVNGGGSSKERNKDFDKLNLARKKMKEEVELDEGVSNLSDARLKFHVLKNVPHGSYSNKELAAEHDRRKKTGGAEYSSVKPSLNEKVANPYAIGMAAAMKKAGDTAPLKKSTIVKGHEIAKSIMKKEAMDPVGKADADIDNDGDVDKSDKYLHARRKAIGKAIRKEEVEQIDEISVKKLDKYRAANEKDRVDLSMNKIGWIKGSPTADQQKNLDKLNKRVKGDQLAGTKTYPTVYKNTPYAAKVPATESVEQIDELSPNTLHSYTKKAALSLAGNASGVGAAVGAGKKPHKDLTRYTTNRVKGIASASGRLADKANSDMHESISDVTMKQLKKKFADGTHEAMNDPEPGRHVELRNTKTGKRTTHYVKEEVGQIDEAFKVGAMKLHDGSAVTLTRESVDALNGLFNQLNGANKSKMEERMMSGKKGFQEILSFAENI